ncbi:trypsin-like peptidase domain-containing protein [Pseudactinotalea sp.]|uniref:trypsin-like peptidase domain-containing protein n=1 Tax=Pseudactinotalea sp. TaxID=1926260 RepID=UPI003B3B4466
MTSPPDDAWAPPAGASPLPRASAPESGESSPTTASQPVSSASPVPTVPFGEPPPGPVASGPVPPQAAALTPVPAARPARRRRGASAAVVVLLMLVSLLAGALLGLVGHRWLFPAEGGATGLPTPDQNGAEGDPVGDTWISEIAAIALPSTVYIEVRTSEANVSGSGFVVREDGYLVTNQHVVAPALSGDGEITVVFSDGTEEAAEVIGSTGDYDLAVLKIDRAGLAPLVLADSDTLAVGDPVIAVGAPLGLSGSVTSGIVSALNRPVTVRDPSAGDDDPSTYINAVQTDAAINRGNSGGPLIDANGHVVGVNTAVARDSSSGGGGNEPGFAIPSNQVRHTVEQLIETGQATYPVIGVLLDVEYEGEGVQVHTETVDGSPPVTPGGPADEAGVGPGDVIVAVDGAPVSQPTELIVRVRSHLPGEVIVLTIRTDDGEHDVEVLLGEAVSR